MLRKMILGCAVFSLLLAGGCASKQPDSSAGMAIYLTAGGLNGAQMEQTDLSKIKLQSQPIIAAGDILSYDARTHEIALSDAAMQRLVALKVPMNGLGFVVTVDGWPVYGGAFWSYLSSLMYEGVTIMVPPLDADNFPVRIGGTYPDANQAPPNDPRADPRVLDALRQTGVLKE